MTACSMQMNAWAVIGAKCHPLMKKFQRDCFLFDFLQITSTLELLNRFIYGLISEEPQVATLR